MSRPEPPTQPLAATTGSSDYRERLTRLRDRLTGAIEECEERNLAPLSARLADVLARLDELPNAERTSTSDDLRARRAARRAAASGQ